ncbi:MAG: hypothetical protein IPK20_26180 [Betaproteobacteria bacterium]|nr:hypothetical protein [Betaproteobacteria bacterium]
MSNVAQVQQFQPGPVMAMQTQSGLRSLHCGAGSDPVAMGHMMKLAEFMAGVVARCRRSSSASGDCLAVVMQAMQWRMNPYAVAQKTSSLRGRSATSCSSSMPRS